MPGTFGLVKQGRQFIVCKHLLGVVYEGVEKIQMAIFGTDKQFNLV